MSYGGNNFRPTRRNWGFGQGYGAHVPNNMRRDYMDELPLPVPRSVDVMGITIPPLPQSFTSPGNQGYGAYVPNSPPGNWRPGQGYVPNMARNYDSSSRPPNVNQDMRFPSISEQLLELLSFPVPPYSPMQFLVLNDDMARDANTRPRVQSTWDSTGGLNMQYPIQESSSRWTQDEQKAALKKLKKEIYNPTPKRLAKRLGMYYRGKNNSSGQEKERDEEDGKRCAICLEDFEPQEAVMVTPCSHMFHEGCIVPWVKSNGQCPVCRFTICERIREISGQSNNNAAIVPANDHFEGELTSVIRMVDEALELGNRTRYMPRNLRRSMH